MRSLPTAHQIEGIENDDLSNGAIKKRTRRGITKMDSIFSQWCNKEEDWKGHN
jgi:succinate dehydrogenase flavin-adding protein (antitoxin of CptAB toxin-antitoxin module)